MQSPPRPPRYQNFPEGLSVTITNGRGTFNGKFFLFAMANLDIWGPDDSSWEDDPDDIFIKCFGQSSNTIRVHGRA